MSTETKSEEFDADKYLRLFEEETGLKISAIASSLQFQSQETKEKNWETFSKSKDELTTFVEIYTIVMSIIAYTLQSNETSKKPSQNSTKALTIKLLPKLPKSDDNKPMLTKSEYMNNLHHVINEIYYEFQDTIQPIRQTTLDKENNLATYFQQQSKTTETPRTPYYDAYTTQGAFSLTTEESMPAITGTPVGKDLQVGAIVTCVEYNKLEIDYAGASCTIKMKYDEDFNGYFVKFDNSGPETYITADKLVLPNTNNTDLETNAGINTVGETKYAGVSTRDNDDLPSIGECGGYVTDGWDRLPDLYKKNCCCRMICLIILIAICSWIIHYGTELTRDGKEYAAEATSETCSVIGFSQHECTFDCDCNTYKEKYGDIVHKCKEQSDDDDCYAYEYIYKATAGEKCGNTELSMNEYDTWDTCTNSAYEVGKELDCYVLDCEDQEFTVTHPDTLTGAGQMTTAIGAVSMVVGVFCCCVIIPLINGKCC